MRHADEHTTQVISYLLFALVITQAVFTALYISEVNPSRQLFWGLEGLLFTILTVFAGAAMVRTQHYHLGFSAIAFSAIFNVVQVSIGATMFVPFREASGQLDAFGPAASAVVALSFMIYYAAKFLLGFAAVFFGLAKINLGSKIVGRLAVLTGIVAMLANGVLIVFGREAFLPSAVAGSSGTLATLFLAFCLITLTRENKQNAA